MTERDAIQKEKDLAKRRRLQEALVKAACAGQLDKMIELIDRGASLGEPNREGQTALMMAAAQGGVECVKELVARGAPLDEKDWNGMTALHWACSTGRSETVEILMRAGCDWEIKSRYGETALELGERNCEIRMVNKIKEMLPWAQARREAMEQSRTLEAESRRTSTQVGKGKDLKL